MASYDIIINKKKIHIYQFDDNISILNRYAINLKDKNEENRRTLTLPQFLRFSKNYEKFEENKKYKIEDIRDILSKWTISSLVNLENLTYIRQLYPNFNGIHNIVYLWLIEKGYAEISLNNFENVYEEKIKSYLQTLQFNFGNANTVYKTINEFIVKIIPSRWKIIRNLVESQTNIYRKIAKKVDYNSLPKILPFTLEEIIEDTFLSTDKGNSLYEIFDALIVLRDDSRSFFKVYEHVIPPNEWISESKKSKQNENDELYSSKAIYFYILNPIEEKITYSKGVWQEGNSIRIITDTLILSKDVKIDKNWTDNIRNKLFSSLKNRIKYNIVDTIQEKVAGKFTILDARVKGSKLDLLNLKGEFNIGVFADLMANNELFSYFLFADESEKSVLKKEKRTVFYYSSTNQKIVGNIGNLTITVTQTITQNDSWLNIRVSRASSLKQVDSFIAIFRYFFAIYKSEYFDIINLYENLYDKVDFEGLIKKIKAKKEDEKTGIRLQNLRKHNPTAFKMGYSTKCQHQKQPYLVTNVSKTIEEFKKAPENIRADLLKNGMLRWPNNSNDLYACYPREEHDKNKTWIFPGLLKQKKNDLNYEEYPTLPCCFVENQFASAESGETKSKTKKKINVTSTEIVNIEDENITIAERPLSEDKLTPKGRIAKLPLNLQNIAILLDYKSIKTKNKISTPFFRLGVVHSPDSFVHCLERAFNKKYVEMSLKQKYDRVDIILNEISRQNDDFFVVSKQELYDYSYDDIRNYFIKKDAYIDPDLFINIFAIYYNCNIVVFNKNKKHPNGELSVPRNSITHLQYKPNPSLKTVIIIKYQPTEKDNLSWPYQCELLIKYNLKKGKLPIENTECSFDMSETFIKNIFKIKNKVNDVYITSGDKYSKYEPSVTL
jgi:hypothetical protein